LRYVGPEGRIVTKEIKKLLNARLRTEKESWLSRNYIDLHVVKNLFEYQPNCGSSVAFHISSLY
jgi:hypothetical protein